MSDAGLPDPLDFAARALSARGALVDREGRRVVALLPPALASSLALPEEAALVAQVAEGAAEVACGIGSPLLERLAADARAAVPWAAVAPGVEAPRASQASALATRVVMRNGVVDVLDALAGEAVYLRATIAWAVEADDRYEGALHLTVGPDGGEPDERVGALLDVTREPPPPEAPGEVDARALLPALAARVSPALAGAARGAVESVERRHARDHARMTEYFAGLAAELGGGRRKLDPATVAARVAALAAERDARLRDLALRYLPKVTAAPVAMVCASLPAVRVRLRARRRKLDREFRLTLPAGAQSLDLLACEGCGGVTARPALCDDRLHTLCERCAPHVQGRLACPACARPRALSPRGSA